MPDRKKFVCQTVKNQRGHGGQRVCPPEKKKSPGTGARRAPGHFCLDLASVNKKFHRSAQSRFASPPEWAIFAAPDAEGQRHIARHRPFEFRRPGLQGLPRPEGRRTLRNEVRVLRHLKAKGCPFVPRLLEANRGKLRIITTNCGTRVEHWTKSAGRKSSTNWKSSASGTTTRTCGT